MSKTEIHHYGCNLSRPTPVIGDGCTCAVANGETTELRQLRHTDLANVCRELLRTIGEDPARPGLVDTPRRFADMWLEFMDDGCGRMDTAFEHASDQLVVVGGLRVWSICEHHLLPFWCDLAIGYIPRGKVLGLSKFARLAHHCAHRLNLQESLIASIASSVEALTDSPDVAVMSVGQHLCMAMRGAKSDHRMVVSEMRGAFRDKPEARAEFLEMARLAGGQSWKV